jgi:hypothetical protein
MAELKKYTSFEALKLDDKSAGRNQPKSKIFSEFEDFLKRLQNEYVNKKKTKIDYGQQPRQ